MHSSAHLAVHWFDELATNGAMLIFQFFRTVEIPFALSFVEGLNGEPIFGQKTWVWFGAIQGGKSL